jgi:hypothetical protein
MNTYGYGKVEPHRYVADLWRGLFEAGTAFKSDAVVAVDGAAQLFCFAGTVKSTADKNEAVAFEHACGDIIVGVKKERADPAGTVGKVDGVAGRIRRVLAHAAAF